MLMRKLKLAHSLHPGNPLQLIHPIWSKCYGAVSFAQGGVLFLELLLSGHCQVTKLSGFQIVRLPNCPVTKLRGDT